MGIPVPEQNGCDLSADEQRYLIANGPLILEVVRKFDYQSNQLFDTYYKLEDAKKKLDEMTRELNEKKLELEAERGANQILAKRLRETLEEKTEEIADLKRQRFE